MTDKALTAFRKWACIRFPTCHAEIQEGLFDKTSAAEAYRAGAAASEARIKALEYEVRELKAQNFRMLSLEDQAQARDRGEA